MLAKIKKTGDIINLFPKDKDGFMFFSDGNNYYAWSDIEPVTKVIAEPATAGSQVSVAALPLTVICKISGSLK